jgi:hypothetical protein
MRPPSVPVLPRVPGASRRRRSVLAAVVVAGTTGVAVVGAGPVGAQAPAPKPPHVLATAEDGNLSRFGPIRVSGRSATLADAYRVFGRATSTRGSGNSRRVHWRAAGVTVNAVTYGSCRKRRCSRTELKIQSARVSGPRWQTAAGLTVGDPMARIAEVYDGASAPGDGSGEVVVVDAETRFGDGGRIPIVTARVRGGVVTSFDVWVGSAGE